MAPASKPVKVQKQDESSTITEAQGKLLYIKADRDKNLIAKVCKEYGYKSTKEIEKEKFQEILGKVEREKLQGGNV